MLTRLSIFNLDRYDWLINVKKDIYIISLLLKKQIAVLRGKKS